MRRSQLVAVFALLLALTGCASDRLPAASVQPVISAPAATAATTPPIPVRVEIPAIKAVSSLIPLHLGPGDVLQTPSVNEPMQAGWYADGYRPGEPGPAVVAGHVDGQVNGKAGQPGIFFRLRDLDIGDKAIITRADGSTVTYVAYRKVAYDKDTFGTDEVYGKTELSELRAITCDGKFNRAKHSYEDNLVVFFREA